MMNRSRQIGNDSLNNSQQSTVMQQSPPLQKLNDFYLKDCKP